MLSVSEIQKGFEMIADSAKRDGMMAYMKGNFDYYGIISPARKELQKDLFPLMKRLSIADQWKLILELFEEPQRELHYFAIDFLNKIPTKAYSEKDMNRVEVLLTKNQWWDSIDAIASNFVGKWFLKFPEKRDGWIAKWRKTNDFWLHRTCLIFQLKHKELTDVDLMENLIQQFKSNKEFFIQKAIGWVLRQHSRIDAIWVEDTVRKQELRGLAKREALRLINN